VKGNPLLTNEVWKGKDGRDGSGENELEAGAGEEKTEDEKEKTNEGKVGISRDKKKDVLDVELLRAVLTAASLPSSSSSSSSSSSFSASSFSSSSSIFPFSPFSSYSSVLHTLPPPGSSLSCTDDPPDFSMLLDNPIDGVAEELRQPIQTAGDDITPADEGK
jgi:hypothetical protein